MKGSVTLKFGTKNNRKQFLLHITTKISKYIPYFHFINDKLILCMQLLISLQSYAQNLTSWHQYIYQTQTTMLVEPETWDKQMQVALIA